MKNQFAQSQLDKIDFVFLEIDSQTLDPRIQGHIAKYMTVLISGIYEECIKKIIVTSVETSEPCIEIQNFIQDNIEHQFRNPDQSNVKKLLKKFSENWVKSIDSNLSSNNWEALESIVTNKNKIAHEGQSTITYSEIKRYYADSRKIIEIIDSVISI